MTSHIVITSLHIWLLCFVLVRTVSVIHAGTISQSVLDRFSKTDIIIELPSVTIHALNHSALSLILGTGSTSYVKSVMKKFTSEVKQG